MHTCRQTGRQAGRQAGHACMHAFMHACMHTYIHTHIHTYMCTHTHTPARARKHSRSEGTPMYLNEGRKDDRTSLTLAFAANALSLHSDSVLSSPERGGGTLPAALCTAASYQLSGGVVRLTLFTFFPTNSSLPKESTPYPKPAFLCNVSRCACSCLGGARSRFRINSQFHAWVILERDLHTACKRLASLPKS